jgi:hypothetical protein
VRSSNTSAWRVRRDVHGSGTLAHAVQPRGRGWPNPSAPRMSHQLEEMHMLWTIFLVLLVLWFLGMVSAYTLGGFIHILLVLAVIALIVQLVSGRRVV